MKIAKWGNSLAIRLPAALVEAMGLSEGDEIEISSAESSKMAVTREPTREERIARLRIIGANIPADFKFNRDEANER